MIDWREVSRIHQLCIANPELLSKAPKSLISLFKYDWLTPLYDKDENQYFGGRPKQLFQNFYSKDKDIVAAICGRGFGKTRAMSEYIKHWLFNESLPNNSILYLAPTYDHLSFLQSDPAGITANLPFEYRPIQKGTKTLYFPKHKVTLYFATPESYDSSARGKNTSLLCIDELCAMEPNNPSYIEEVFDNAYFANRINSKSYPKTLITTTPRPTSFLKKLLAQPNVEQINGTTFENYHLNDSWKEKLAIYKGTEREAQELNGQIIFDNVHNLFPPIHLNIDPNYQSNNKSIQGKTRVIIAIDPAVTVSSTSDESGIIVFSKYIGTKASEHKMIIEEDLSGKYTIQEIQNKVIEMKQKYDVLGIVMETNQGGQTIIAHFQHLVKEIKPIFSSSKKGVRAALVSPYWESNQIIFKKEFKQLQEQLFDFNPRINNNKDDHLDAFVFAGIQTFNLYDLLNKRESDDTSILSKW